MLTSSEEDKWCDLDNTHTQSFKMLLDCIFFYRKFELMQRPWERINSLLPFYVLFLLHNLAKSHYFFATVTPYTFLETG